MYQMQIHLLLASLFPIYIGAHASLRRPPSAKAPPTKARGEDEEEDDDEIDVEPIVEGLRPSDAIMFPVMASITLGGLYFIIKWLDDPALLNKFMGWYFSALGVFGVGKLVGDALHVLSTIIFPSVWSDGKNLYHIEPHLRLQVTGSPTRTQPHRTITSKASPLPSLLSKLSLPKPITNLLWTTRSLLKSHWIFRCYIHGVFTSKTRLTIHDITGLLLGLTAIIAYNTLNKPWLLTNIMGFGFCYGAFQLMSPTTFWTGSLVLIGLFFYDIVMVFYTPMMVTVATTLDVPIKLVFPALSGSKRDGMLGLGDVVLPGIVMALALRFDLYLHYLRKQAPGAAKPEYVDATGLWGERFWTAGSGMKNVADAARFRKTYFWASVGGYVVGMLTTLVVLEWFHHAQPALLYLVPGVLISLWGTAWVRGEVPLMWGYTEDGSLEEASATAKEPKVEDQVREKKETNTKEHAHHIFLFSLSEPRRGVVKGKMVEELKEE